MVAKKQLKPLTLFAIIASILFFLLWLLCMYCMTSVTAENVLQILKERNENLSGRAVAWSQLDRNRKNLLGETDIALSTAIVIYDRNGNLYVCVLSNSKTSFYNIISLLCDSGYYFVESLLPFGDGLSMIRE